ncbi:enoyl-CoA hydratase/isomerase family protein [Oricola thermophila]|uniref:Enoyl-CoA hydratase/isomerase family protein n=2 Tax=Oricola thermophila TaxID=2742145 RepID=A0A6N1VI45_9HYPH|nr:enoyl-CoA hydratase/isomerase family protein [Oricola thermophila]
MEMCGAIAVLTIDNPPVNAGSHAVRAGLIKALQDAEMRGAKGAVLIGAGRTFVAGSDMREFDDKLRWPELPDVIAALEAVSFPVIAAMHGVALGGGLELALGCDYRIASPGTKLGLPEVSLGFVPGAGGTQRLPRLIGIRRAIAMVCGSERISAEEALDLNLIDMLAGEDLLQAAVDFLSAERRPKRVLRTIEVPREPDTQIEAAAERALHLGRRRPNVVAALELVRRSREPDADRVLAEERATFQRLRRSDEAKALRYLFFAERRAGSVPGLDRAEARPIERAGVIGGGTMGQGITLAFLAAGLTVTLIERDAAALDHALSRIRENLSEQVRKGRISAAEHQAHIFNLHGATDISAVGGCDVAIEAVYEDMAAKRQVVTALESVLAPDALIATNTSYLDIDAMAEGTARPERVLGLHFFSPADIMKLLEIVRAGRTSDAVLATALKLARKLDKKPVVARVAEGFIGNRVYAAYRRRAELLVLDGASPEAVDAAATAFGFAMGPFAVSDLSGLDIAWAMRKRQAATRDPEARYVEIPDLLCEAGRLGRKSGKGWYDYSGGGAKVDPEVDALIDAARARAGVVPRDFDTSTIQQQLLAAIVNEAACLVEDGVAARASDVDVAFVNGYGFPRWRGGPLYWATRQDRTSIECALADLADAVGPGHRAGGVADVLSELDAGTGA